jgi:hypothetical protein
MQQGANGIGEVEGRRGMYCYDGKSTIASTAFPYETKEEKADYGTLYCESNNGSNNGSNSSAHDDTDHQHRSLESNGNNRDGSNGHDRSGYATAKRRERQLQRNQWSLRGKGIDVQTAPAAPADDSDSFDEFEFESAEPLETNRQRTLHGNTDDVTSTPFSYQGINIHTCEPAKILSVEEARIKPLADWSTSDGRYYPAPAYSVVLEPSRGRAEGKEAIKRLVRSGYIDRQTRIIFMDMALFNPMVQHVCWIRLAAEVRIYGDTQI